jgi:hypothetical protein
VSEAWNSASRSSSRIRSKSAERICCCALRTHSRAWSVRDSARRRASMGAKNSDANTGRPLICPTIESTSAPPFVVALDHAGVGSAPRSASATGSGCAGGAGVSRCSGCGAPT